MATDLTVGQVSGIIAAGVVVCTSGVFLSNARPTQSLILMLQ